MGLQGFLVNKVRESQVARRIVCGFQTVFGNRGIELLKCGLETGTGLRVPRHNLGCVVLWFYERARSMAS